MGKSKIKLFNSELIDWILSMIIDNKDEKIIVDEYNFTSKGEHNFEIFLKKEINFMEKLFKGCTNLTQIDLSQIESRNISNIAEMFFMIVKNWLQLIFQD